MQLQKPDRQGGPKQPGLTMTLLDGRASAMSRAPTAAALRFHDENLPRRDLHVFEF